MSHRPSGEACRPPHSHCWDLLDSRLTLRMSTLELIFLEETFVLTTSQIPQLHLTLKHYLFKEIDKSKASSVLEYSPMWKFGAEHVSRLDLQRAVVLLKAFVLQPPGPGSICCELLVQKLRLSDGQKRKLASKFQKESTKGALL